MVEGFWGGQPFNQDIVPISMIPVDICTKAKMSVENKLQTLQEHIDNCNKVTIQMNEKGDSSWVWENFRVVERIFLSPQDYDYFCAHLMDRYAWLKGKGGYDYLDPYCWNVFSENMTKIRKEYCASQYFIFAVAIAAEGRETFLVAPEGFPYARYVAFIAQSVNQLLEQFK